MLTPKRSREDEAWDLLRHQHTDEALALLREESGGNRVSRASLGYGAALMWAGQYKAATEHLEGVIETSRMEKIPMMASENHYSLCGAGRWCLGDSAAAVKLWRLGIKAPYATYGICLECPLLLVLVSILAPELCDRAEALELLKQRASDPRVRDYPGTLAQFVVGAIDNEALQSSVERSQARYAQCSNRDRKWNVAFYRAVLDLEQSVTTRAEFKRLTESMTDFSQFDDLDSTEFWWLTRCAEFYVARHEALPEGMMDN
jgi:hypothetical protein